MAESAFLWLLLVALAWVPFLYGSNVLVAWGVNAVLFPGLAGLYEVSLLLRGKHHPVGINRLTVPAVLFAAVVAWIFVQNASWVPSSLTNPIWGMAAKALGRPIQGSISVNRDLTSLALLRLVTAASVFWLALQLSRDGARAQKLMIAIALIGAVYAVYGIVAMKTGQPPWLAMPMEHGKVRATFVNPDSYASYAGIGLIAASGLLLQLYRHDSPAPGRWQPRLASFIETTGERGALLLACGFTTLAALLLTGSRGGAAATGIGFVALGLLRPRRNRRRRSLWPLALASAILAMALFAFGEVLGGKIEGSGLYDPNRMAVYILTLRSIRDLPLVGYGYGTFRDVFPMFRDHSLSVWGFWAQAHNTYLEVFQGLGVVFGTALILCVLLLVLRCAKGALRRRQNATIPRVAASAACLVGTHALVDFSLQMPAVAITLMAVLGAGVAQSESTGSSRTTGLTR